MRYVFPGTIKVEEFGRVKADIDEPIIAPKRAIILDMDKNIRIYSNLLFLNLISISKD
jgi:hypothetical protein